MSPGSLHFVSLLIIVRPALTLSLRRKVLMTSIQDEFHERALFT